MTSGNSEMMEALQALATERGMSAETLMSALADALETAYKKMPGAHEFAWVTIDPDTFDIKVNAQEIDEDGNPYGPELDATPDNFGRIAAQTARQVMMQRLARSTARRSTRSTPVGRARSSTASSTSDRATRC